MGGVCGAPRSAAWPYSRSGVLPVRPDNDDERSVAAQRVVPALVLEGEGHQDAGEEEEEQGGQGGEAEVAAAAAAAVEAAVGGVGVPGGQVGEAVLQGSHERGRGDGDVGV